MTRAGAPDLLGLPVLDLDHLARQTFADPVLQRDLLTLFAAQCDRLGPEIDGPSPAEALFAAHTLRGGANAVGAARVGALAGQLEALLETGDHAPSTAVTAALRAAVADARAAMAELLRPA